MAAQPMEYPQPNAGQTAIPNRLLTDNRLPDSVVRIYGTLANLARPTQLDLAGAAITLARTLEAPRAFIPQNRQAQDVHLPKISDGKLTREWDPHRFHAWDGPATTEGETLIPNAVMSDLRLSSRDVRVYGLLKMYDTPEAGFIKVGFVVAPHAMILWTLSNMSEGSLQNSIRTLIKAGYIERVEHEQFNVPSVYRLLAN